MPVHIDNKRCNGCPKRPEGLCEAICPGDLLYRKNGKAVIREPADCWDCFACVKACPCSALWIELPFQISETKVRLSARIKNNRAEWNLLDKKGTSIAVYTIPIKECFKKNVLEEYGVGKEIK
jgi:adenylylsulfate reductase subunit B